MSSGRDSEANFDSSTQDCVLGCSQPFPFDRLRAGSLLEVEKTQSRFSPKRRVEERQIRRRNGTAPQGRLKIAQDEILGRINKNDPVPLGTAENAPGCNPGCSLL